MKIDSEDISTIAFLFVVYVVYRVHACRGLEFWPKFCVKIHHFDSWQYSSFELWEKIVNVYNVEGDSNILLRCN